MPHKVESWNSLAEFAQHVATAERHWTVDSSRGLDEPAWRGSASFEQAVEWATYGNWPCPDLPKIESAVRDALGKPETRLEFVPDVVGVRPNVPAFVAGDPCSMWLPEFHESPRRIVRVLYNRGARAQTSPEDIVTLGVELTALLAKLETDALVSTQLDVCTSSRVRNGLTYTCLVSIKKAGQPFDLSELAFGLISPAFLRRLSFAARETLPLENQAIDYGYSTDPPSDVLSGYDIYIPPIGPDKTVKDILPTLEQFYESLTRTEELAWK